MIKNKICFLFEISLHCSIQKSPRFIIRKYAVKSSEKCFVTVPLTIELEKQGCIPGMINRIKIKDLMNIMHGFDNSEHICRWLYCLEQDIEKAKLILCNDVNSTLCKWQNNTSDLVKSWNIFADCKGIHKIKV